MDTKVRTGHHLNETLGNFTSLEQRENGLFISAENGSLTLTTYSPTVVKVRPRIGPPTGEAHSYAVVGQPGNFVQDLVQEPERIVVRTAGLEIRIRKFPLRIAFYTHDGALLQEDHPAFGFSRIGTEVTAYKSLAEGERFVGLGEKTGNLDRRGSACVNWNTDYFGYPEDGDPLYLTAPFFIGIQNGQAYGLFLDNSYKTTFNFGASNDRFMYFSAEDGELTYYFFGGKDVAAILSDYTALTGRMEMPPLWSLGYQQCRYSYYPDSEVLAVARNFRDKGIPADVIYLDIHYMDAYKVFTFHPERFPDPKGLMKKLKAMGFRVTVIVDPGVKREEGYEVYEDGKAKNMFVKYPDGEDYAGEVWPGWSHFPDFTKPEVRAWWGEQFGIYVENGVEGFWNDMNEPAAWGQHLPNLIEFDYEGEGGTHRKARNVYGMQMARATAEGTRKLMKGRRPFILTRAGFSGIQRYAAAWTGDNVASDGHMLAGVRLVNSMGLTGMAFAGYDVGGFVGAADQGLFARWISIGAFSPFFRGHSMINSRDAEPWAFGEEVEEIARNYIRLRYQLIPYLYSAFYAASQNGLPVARSLAIDYTHDPNIYDPKFQNQYLFGPDILVAPVESTKELAKVYLPKGTWFDLFTDKKYDGEQEWIVECPKERLPLFVRGAAILPMQSVVQSLAEKPAEVLELHVYGGMDRNELVFYEDDGETYEYQRGACYWRKIVLDVFRHTLRLEAVEGSFASKFTRLRIWFHAIEGLSSSLEVNGRFEGVGKAELAFVDPISAFDPLGAQAGTDMFVGELPVLEIENIPGEIVIEW